MLVGYYLICPRKAWLSMRGLWMEQESETVALGRLIDEKSYRRRRAKDIMIDVEAPDGTNLVGKIDGANLRKGILHEVKKGRSCEEAHVWQLRFYLWLLSLSGVTRKDGVRFKGQLDYPALRRTKQVYLEDAHKSFLKETVHALAALSRQPDPPARHKSRSFCKKCAFEDLCYA